VEDEQILVEARLGIGGIGAFTISDRRGIQAQQHRAVPGAYAQGRYGLAGGNKSAGDLWVQNDAGGI
jgi:hypothetical protein